MQFGIFLAAKKTGKATKPVILKIKSHCHHNNTHPFAEHTVRPFPMLPKVISIPLLTLSLLGNINAAPSFPANISAIEQLSVMVPAGCVDSVAWFVQPVFCHGLRTGEIRITGVSGGLGPYYFSLDGQNFTTNPIFDRLWAGKYTLIVRDNLGCTLTKTIAVQEAPELKVKLFASKTKVDAGEPIFLWAEVVPPGNEVIEISWRPPNLFEYQDTFLQNIRLSSSEIIAIEIKTSAGCTARDHLAIEVEQSKVYVPNSFMPNSALNSFFTVYAGDGVALVRTLRVLDRWGKTIFESHDFPANDPFRGWDGKANGKQAPPGVYSWAAEIEYLDQTRKVISGDVTLIRDLR